MKQWKREVCYSMTSVLCALIRGDIVGKDIEGERFWFNCTRDYLFNNTPIEATWAEGREKAAHFGPVKFSDLSENQQKALNTLRGVIVWAEQRGDVSWREDRTKYIQHI